MKLLFDQNLSHRLVALLAEEFPDSLHVRQAGLAQAPDKAVWAYARENGYRLVSKDEDFHQMSFVLGSPPQVVWVRLGNCTTAQVEACLRVNRGAIEAFGENEEAAFLIVTSGTGLKT